MATANGPPPTRAARRRPAESTRSGRSPRPRAAARGGRWARRAPPSAAPGGRARTASHISSVSHHTQSGPGASVEFFHRCGYPGGGKRRSTRRLSCRGAAAAPRSAAAAGMAVATATGRAWGGVRVPPRLARARGGGGGAHYARMHGWRRDLHVRAWTARSPGPKKSLPLLISRHTVATGSACSCSCRVCSRNFLSLICTMNR